jgi:hypothetical protein
MAALKGFADFDADKDLPSLKGKVILITGGKTLFLAALALNNGLDTDAHLHKAPPAQGKLPSRPWQDTNQSTFTSPDATPPQPMPSLPSWLPSTRDSD